MAKSFSSLKFDTRNAKKKTSTEKAKNFQDLKPSNYDFSLVKSELENTIRFDTFETDLSSMGKTIEDISTSWQTQETMQNTRASVESMQNRLRAFKEYTRLFSGNNGSDVSKIIESYGSVLDDWDVLAKEYGKYTNAESYTKETSMLKELGSMTSSDVESKLTEIKNLEKVYNVAKKYDDKALDYSKQSMNLRNPSAVDGFSKNLKKLTDERDAYLKSIGYESMDTLEKALSDKRIAYTTVGGENIIWQSLYDQKKEEEESNALYKEISSRDDFEKYKKEGENIENPTFKEADRGINLFGWKPFAEDVGNIGEFAHDNKEMITLSNAYASFGDDNIYYTYMTNQERDIHNYHLGQERTGLVEEGTANEYLKSLLPTLKKRHENQTISNLVGYTDEHPVLGSAISVWQNLGAGGEYLYDSAKYLTTNELDTNHLAKASSSIRNTVSEKVDWEIGNWDAFDFVYNTGMSMSDSAVAMATFGGAGGVALGFSAAAQGTNDALARGLDNKGAFLSGLSAGVFEGLFESVSIGKFKALKDAPVDGIKTIIKNVGKSMLTNASEETLTELANLTYDYIVNGDLSQAKTNIRAYVNSGMSEEEAIRKVALEQASQVVEAGASGLLMGFGFGGVAGVSAYNTSKNIGQGIKANERVSDLFDIANNPEIAEAYETYTRYANKGINADNVSNAQLGRLYNEVKTDAVEKVNSKKSTDEQRTNAFKTLTELSIVDTENTVKKEAKKLNVGEETKITDSGVAVDIKDLKVKGNEVTVATEKGDISVDDMTLTQKDAELVVMAKGIAQTEGENVANLFLNQYDGKTDVYEYANSFNLTVAYAKNNFRYDTILRNKGELSSETVSAIYQEARIKADQEQKAKFQKLAKQMADKKFYKGFIDESAIDYNNTSAEGKVNWNDLTQRQREAVTFVKGIAQATGMNLVFVANNPEFNGNYNRTKNILTINLDKGGFDTINNLKETIIPTMSHETTHWMKEKSPELWRHLNEIVFSTLAEHYNSNTEQAIKDKIAILDRLDPKIKHTEEDAKERTITEEDLIRAEMSRKGESDDVAREEIVARACEDMLKMSEQGRKIFSSLSETEQKSLFEKMKAIIKDLLNWVNDLLNSYEATSTEARIMREYKDQLEKASKVWDKMLEDSVKVNQALEKSGAFRKDIANVGLQLDAETNSIAPDTLLSEKTWRESEYVQDRETAINAIVKALNVTEKEAERYVDNINGIARMIADDRARLDYESNIDEHASALKTNKEYKWTVDMSTLCAKRLLFTGTFDAIQKKLPNTIFNSDDIVALRSMMMKRGYEVACGICYVESTRRELGPITAEFIERYKLAQKNGTPISKINSAGKEVILQEKGTKRNFYAEDGYVPTLAELNTTDIDLVKRDHPEVYAAYLSFMKSRGQAIPKLLETRTEYKGEILKHFNSKSAVTSRNDAGGLRVQSFSDFEVAHLIDMMQIVLDMSRVGLMSQAYTKVPAFADVFGNTGMKINLSLIAKGSGLDADGNLIFDDVEGMPHKEAFRLRDKYSKNVGTILVGKNDAHIRKALADPRIDFVIPFHKSFWKESLYDALGLTGYEDYTETQNEKPFDKDRKIKNFQPSEYWDYSKSGKENAETYLKMCEEDGRIPKFPQFQNCEGYWKLLIDFKMYDNDGVGSPQMVVKPEFSMDDANSILNSYEGGHRTFPVAQDVVDDFVKQYEGRKDILYSGKDTNMEVIDIPFAMYSKMENHFGTTKNYDVAGYLLRDGKMLDFSGKHWSSNAPRGVVWDSRQVDHRDIQEVLNDDHNGVQAMMSMISNGNIRLMPEVGGINLSAMPNGFQADVLRGYINHFEGEVVVDIDAEGGDTIHSFEYSKGTSASKVLSDLEGYFRRGEIPSRTKSALADFLYSEKDISVNMSEDERYEILKDKKIPLVTAITDETIDFEYLGNNIKSVVEKGLLKKFQQLGIFKKYHSLAIKDVYFDFTGKGFRKSIHSQENDYGGNKADFAKVLLNLQNLLDSSILIESHTDKGKGTSREKRGLETVYVLLGALKDGDVIVPVQFEVEQYLSDENRLYLAVALTKIETGVKGNTAPDEQKATSLLPISNVSISDIFSKINPVDKNILKYVPNQFLNEEQIEAKNEALEIERRKYSNGTLLPEKDSEGNTLTKEQQEYFKDSKVRDKNGNLLVVYHGSPESFTIFDTHKDTSSIIYDASFFTSDESKAKAYANKNFTTGQLYKGYVNIKSPLVPIEVREQIKLIPDSVKEQYQSEFDIKDAVSKTNYAIIDFAKYVARKENSTMATVLKTWGFDGYINGKDCAIFEPEQFKNIDNTNPTTNPDIRYSEKEQTSIYDIMGETERILKENEKLKDDVERLNERLKIERKVTHGNVLNNNQLLNVAGHLRKISNSNIDKVNLARSIKDVYSFIATAPNLTWEEVFGKSYRVAKDILAEAKPVTMTDDYSKQILNEIRNTRIRLSDVQKNEAQHIFGKNWNRNFFGRVIITDSGTPIDMQWQEWASMYPDLFDATISDTDMLGELYDIIGTLQDASETIMEYDAEEQARWLANEIYNQYWNVSPVRTTADRYEKRIKQLNFEHRKAMAEFREKYNTRINTKLKEQREADKERYNNLVKKLRERKEKEIAMAKQHGKDMMSKYKENAERKTVIQSILSTTTSLNKKLITNSKETHIPESLKPVVINLINAIDFSSKQMLGMDGSRRDRRGTPTKSDVALENRFGKVKSMADDGVTLKQSIQDTLEMFQNAEKVANNTADGTMDLSLVSLDVDLIDSIKELITGIDILEKNYGSALTLQQMEFDHLKTLNATVKSISVWASNVDRALSRKHKARISQLGEETIYENDALGERQEYIKTIESLKQFFSWSNLLPVNAFKRLGNSAMKVFDFVRDAQDELTFHQDEITTFTEKLFKGHDVNKWREDIKEFKLNLPNGDTKTVRMPVSYIMTLYCVSKQEDAQRHLYGVDENGNQTDGGGMTIAPFQEKRSLKVSKDIDNTIMTEGLIKQITSALTKEQMEIADKLQEFMNTKGSEWCDEVSMALYGIKKFDVENYFPITVTPTTIKVLDPQDKRQSIHFFSILNYGFTKSRNPDAKQSIEIGDVFEIFANHMSMASIYSAYALPIYDMVRWYNYKGKDENGKEIGVIKSIQKAFGNSATTYIGRLISDLNGQHESSRLGFVTKIFQNTKLAMVGNSLSVALLQPTAYLKAMTKIPTRYLLKSLLYVKDFGVKKGVEKSKKYCGIALWKSKGNFDNDISVDVKTQMMHDETLPEKFKEWSLWLAGKMDEKTWGMLWNACEFEVRDTRKDLKVGSEEFFETVAYKLRDVIYETQVVDSPLTRSDLMRSPDTGAKMITMFASEITVAYNIVHEALVDAKLDAKRYGKEGSLKRNGKKIAMALTAYTLTSAVSQILYTAVQAFRDDDDEEKEFEDYLKMYLSNFVSDWLIVGKIPYVKEILNYAQGYSSSRPDTLWLDSTAKAIKYWGRAFDGKEGAGEKAIKESLKSMSYLSGIPMYNQYRDLMASLDKLGILTAEDFEEMLDDLFN